MYPTNSNAVNNPIFCIGHAIPQMPCPSSGYETIIIPNPKQSEEGSYSTYNFSSPYILYDDYSTFFQNLYELNLHEPILQQQQQPAVTTTENTADGSIAEAKSNADEVFGGKRKRTCDGTASKFPRKRTSKKDRHSKIQTAKGTRDRRIRLSLDVAPKFFGLQDSLGLETASRVVEWLMEKSKSDIDEVAKSKVVNMKQHSSSFIGANSASSTSEVVSAAIDERTSSAKAANIKKAKPSPAINKAKKIRASLSRKAGFHQVAKQSREKARERARLRTIEKKRLSHCAQKFCSGFEETNRCQELDKSLGSSVVGVGTDKGSSSVGCCQGQHVKPSSIEILPTGDDHVEEPIGSSLQRQILAAEEDIADDSLVMSGNWSPFSLFSYHQHNPAAPHDLVCVSAPIAQFLIQQETCCITQQGRDEAQLDFCHGRK